MTGQGVKVMKIMRVLHKDQPMWAIADGANAYALQGDPYASPTKGALIGPVDGLKILSPILAENKVVVILANWGDRDDRDWPAFVIKPATARINPGETIIYPKVAARVHFETELGIVVGKKCKGITPQQARNHILGYTIHNDMTAFEFTKKIGPFEVLLGKGFDTFSECGPCIATDVDPTNLTMRGRLNGEQFFETNSGQMLWNAYELVSWVSQVMPLFPGDVISCGAPPGALSRPTRPGDHITLIIDGIGAIENNVHAE
jgi:2-keto-4-pentenoate hydratase/2-oxohepta-3-ene-1,7-dioic acid hydratase in catechol pathway